MYIVVDSSNVNDYLKKRKQGNWIVWYYADWCGHCHHMQPEWESFVEEVKNNKNINLAKIQDTMLDKIKVQILGYPSIQFHSKGKKISEFNQERNASNLIKFTNNNIRKMRKRVMSKRKKPKPIVLTKKNILSIKNMLKSKSKRRSKSKSRTRLYL